MTLSPTLIRPSKIHIAIVEINLGEVIFEEDWQSTCITQAMPSGADQTDLDLVRDLAGYARNALWQQTFCNCTPLCTLQYARASQQQHLHHLAQALIAHSHGKQASRTTEHWKIALLLNTRDQVDTTPPQPILNCEDVLAVNLTTAQANQAGKAFCSLKYALSQPRLIQVVPKVTLASVFCIQLEEFDNLVLCHGLQGNQVILREWGQVAPLSAFITTITML